MDNSEKIEFPMGSECKLDYDLNYITKTVTRSIWQRTEPSEGEEAEHDEWNMISKVRYRCDHPKKLARLLKELKAIEEKTQ
jgi:hypothetical protein